MRSPAAQILETALALQRAPGERFRLRERPLPPGVIHLMEVAAASPQALQAASAELGEPAPTLVEAARFYLEQVLFADPAADAYRVLGLDPSAPQDTIRIHQRWLQRWLHPDRAQAGDASVFATRVNQAFAQLRSPESRHAYDVRLAEARLAQAAAPLDPGTLRHWEHEEPPPRHGGRSRWLLAAALAACVVLAVLIVRNPDRGAAWDPDDAAGNAADAEAAAPQIEDRDLGVLSAALAVQPAAPPADAPDTGTPDIASAGLPSDAPTATVPEAIRQPMPAPVPVPVPAAAFVPAPPVERPHGAIVAKVSTVPASSASPPRSSSSPAVQQPPSPERIATALAAAATVPAPAAPAVASPAPPATSVAAAPPPSSPAPEARKAAPRAPAATEDPAVMLERMRQAQQRVAQVAAFLAARPGAAPMWNDPQAEAQAARLRDRLNARKGSRLELERPNWRLKADSASVSADYRCRSAGSDPCQGRLDVELVWREGLWLVRGVDLGPPA